MKLKQLFQTLSPEERALQLGIACENPLTGAFPQKRVVHAGMQGTMLSPGQGHARWREFMLQSPEERTERAAYIHIPFCQTKCLYCNFFQNASEQNAEDYYVDCLIREMERDAKLPQLKDGLIQAVFIGGGTPTSLSPANAKRLLQAIRRCLPLANDYELTLEGRAKDLLPEKMDIWMENGVNRVSIGVQSFHTRIRRQIGRVDDRESLLKRLQMLKAYQQCSVVVDLIYGLPDQGRKEWEEDLQMLVDSAVDGMDLYQLNVFHGSELEKQIAEKRISAAAGTPQQAELYAFAQEFVAKHDFSRLSVCHWRRNNRERSLYNTMAKRGEVIFPFGCGAGGNVAGHSMMLHRGLMPYQSMVEENVKPLMAMAEQTPIQSLINQVLDQLERGFLDLQALVKQEERLADLSWLYEQWVDKGLVTHQGLYRLTVAGEFWQVNLAQTTVECMQYLLLEKHSLSVQGIAAQDRHAHHMKGKIMPPGHMAVAMQGRGQ